MLRLSGKRVTLYYSTPSDESKEDCTDKFICKYKYIAQVEQVCYKCIGFNTRCQELPTKFKGNGILRTGVLQAFSGYTGAVILLSLLLKLLLININQGEYTDGIIQLHLWDSPVVFFPPGYTAAVWLLHWAGLDLLFAGRLLSILASTVSLIFFTLLARLILKNDEDVFRAVLFLALSPVFNRWSFRVMTDSLFLTFFMLCTYEVFLLWKAPGRSRVWLFCWTGLASLVRYQGFYFLPWILYFLLTRRKNDAGFSLSSLIRWCISIIPWMILIYWIAIRGFGHHEQFLERGSYGFWYTLSAYYTMLETYLLYFPWAVTYCLFILGSTGVFLSCNSEDQSARRFFHFSWITALAFLLVQSAFLSFQYRYLLPLVPLWCILAARGCSGLVARLPNRQWGRGISFATVLNLVLMSIAILYFQRDTFGDLVQSAKYLNVVYREARVVSDEVYRQGVYNVKMKFWSGREMEYYPQTDLRPGDLVVLHNTYSDIETEINKIREQFKFNVVFNPWQSREGVNEYVTLPLLPDIMVFPDQQVMPLTSNPQCMGFRFVPQRYYSVILYIEDVL